MRPAGSDDADAVVSQQLYVFIPLHDSWRVMKLGRFPVRFLALCFQNGWISASGHFVFAQKDRLPNEHSQTLLSHSDILNLSSFRLCLINQQTSLIWSDPSLL